MARVATSSLVARAVISSDNLQTREERGEHSFNRLTKFVLNWFNSSNIPVAESAVSVVRPKGDIVFPTSAVLGMLSIITNLFSRS